MSRVEIRPGGPLRGRTRVPGDKSITQRAVLLGALAEGDTRIGGPNDGADARAALGMIRALGVRARASRDAWIISGGTMRESEAVLDARNSGTALRLSLGLLAAQPFFSVLSGDASLRRRPVGRVIEPLRALGAELSARGGDRLPPVAVRGRPLRGADVRTPVASAQVKSAVLLAAIQAEGVSVVSEPAATRDHTERMLPAFGIPVRREGTSARVEGPARPLGAGIEIPGDLSAASFLFAAAALVPRSDVVVERVGVNPTRRAFLDLLARSGVPVTLENERSFGEEPVADVRVRAGGALRPFRIDADEASRLIDELPIAAALAAFADGTSEVRGARELRVKESDRIAAVTKALRAIGVDVEEHEDGWTIHGKAQVGGGHVDAEGDHRIAMAFLVAGLRAKSGVAVDGAECAAVSDPGFVDRLRSLLR